MLTPEPAFDDEHEPVAPECRGTVEALQSLLDGAAPDTLDADTHAGACPTCRERVRAARVLLSVLTAPEEPVPVPAGFTDRVMSGVWDSWRARRRARVRYASRVAAVFALAAAVLVAAFMIVAPQKPQPQFVQDTPAPGDAGRPEPVPAPREKAPEPRPIRINDEVAKAGQAFRAAPNPLADSVAAAPKLFDAFATVLRNPVEPIEPMGDMLEPARRSLAELPDAARAGLEPVTGTAQKAFDRLLRDVAAVKPKS